MSIKRIAQPYVVFWKYDEKQAAELREWCVTSLLNPYVVFAPEGASETYLVDFVGVTHEAMGQTSLFMFQCPRDAMLFKLTWGGE